MWPKVSTAIEAMIRDATLAAEENPEEVLPLLLAAIRTLDLRLENLESLALVERLELNAGEDLE